MRKQPCNTSKKSPIFPRKKPTDAFFFLLQTIQAQPVLARCLSQIAQRLVDADEGAAPADAADRQLLAKFLCAVVMHEGGGASLRLACL